MANNQDVVERIERIAKAFGVSKRAVHLDFRIYAEEDGGPQWSIYVEVPDKDRRKASHHVHAAAVALDQAEQELLATLQPKKKSSRADAIRALHKQGLLTDAERDQALASIATEGSS